MAPAELCGCLYTPVSSFMQTTMHQSSVRDIQVSSSGIQPFPLQLCSAVCGGCVETGTHVFSAACDFIICVGFLKIQKTGYSVPHFHTHDDNIRSQRTACVSMCTWYIVFMSMCD